MQSLLIYNAWRRKRAQKQKRTFSFSILKLWRLRKLGESFHVAKLNNSCTAAALRKKIAYHFTTSIFTVAENPSAVIRRDYKGILVKHEEVETKPVRRYPYASQSQFHFGIPSSKMAVFVGCLFCFYWISMEWMCACVRTVYVSSFLIIRFFFLFFLSCFFVYV